MCSVNDLKEVFEEPQVQYNKILQTVEHPEIGTVRLPAAPIKVNHCRPEIRTAPPTLGESTTEILTEILQLSPQRIEELRTQKVI